MARATEKPFELIDHESEALISGVVDLLEGKDASPLPSEREIVGLVDFKASRIDTIEKYREVEESVRDQLQLYAVGVRYAFDKEPATATARIVSPSGLDENLIAEGCREWIDVPVDKEAQTEASRKLADTIGRIKQQLETNLFPTTGATRGVCRKCDFRVFCSGYAEYCRAGGPDAADPPAESVEKETDNVAEDLNARTTSE